MCLEQAFSIINSTGTLIAAIAALITAIVTCKMVKEMKRQQRNAQIPDILAINSPFIFSKHAEEDRFTIGEEKLPNNATRNIPPSLLIFNVGQGPAKNIRAEWEYSIDEFKQAIDQFDKYKTINVRANDGRVEIVYADSFQGEGLGVVSSDINFREIPFVLPSSQNSMPRKVTLPLLFCNLYSAWFQVAIADRVDEFDDYEDPIPVPLPPLIKLKLEYFDMLGNYYKRSMLVTPKVFLAEVSATDPEKIRYINGSFIISNTE